MNFGFKIFEFFVNYFNCFYLNNIIWLDYEYICILNLNINNVL